MGNQCRCSSVPKSPGAADQDGPAAVSPSSGWIDAHTELDCCGNKRGVPVVQLPQERSLTKQPPPASPRAAQTPPGDDGTSAQSPVSRGKNVRARPKRRAARQKNQLAELQRQEELLKRHCATDSTPARLAQDTAKLAQIQEEIARSSEQSAFGCDLDVALSKACAECGSVSCIGDCGRLSRQNSRLGRQNSAPTLPPLKGPVHAQRTRTPHRKMYKLSNSPPASRQLTTPSRQLTTASGRPFSSIQTCGTREGAAGGQVAETTPQMQMGHEELLSVQLEFFDQYVFLSSRDELTQLCIQIVARLGLGLRVDELQDLITEQVDLTDTEWHFDEFKDWFDAEVLSRWPLTASFVQQEPITIETG